jgi:DNA invertase Pin-like site-specific DNA recombinase
MATNINIDNIKCFLCNKGDNENILILCDGCEYAYHTYCINLNNVPAGDWYCPKCSFGKMTIKCKEEPIESEKKTTTSKQVIIYERVSSAGQDRPEYGRVGLETQNFTILDHCRKNNLTIIRTYSDVGSGKFINELMNLGEMVTTINNNTDIIIYSVSRIGRNYDEVKKLINILHKKNCSIYSVTEKLFSTDTKFDDLLKQAERESENLSRLIKNSIRRRKELGGHIGRVPYGYIAYRDTNGIRKIKINPLEKNIINIIKSKIESPKKIANYLNKTGKLKRGNMWKPNMIRSIIYKSRKRNTIILDYDSE